MEERVYAREAEESRSSINHTSVCQVVFGGLLNCSVGYATGSAAVSVSW